MFAALVVLSLAASPLSVAEEISAAPALIVSVSDGWTATKGRLVLFVRGDGGFVPVERADVSLGTGGMGWGRGVDSSEGRSGPVKAEGDGRAPAGVFRLGGLHGYASSAPPGVKLPYAQSSASDFCVDDPDAGRYNQLVRLRKTERPGWKSAEKLLRNDHLYEWLVTVDHNGLLDSSRVAKRSGSCVFLHVWRAEGKPTLGCTAMEKAKLISVARALPPSGALLVQLPKAEYEARRKSWGLPSLESR